MKAASDRQEYRIQRSWL